jgi:hypothetical protein
MSKALKTESLIEFLKRGGKVKKLPKGETEGVRLTVNVQDRPEPAYYEMDCDPNTISAPLKPIEDLLGLQLDNEVGSDSDYESSQQPASKRT